jgi:O-antigen/teichoic acid export membrane protein
MTSRARALSRDVAVYGIGEVAVKAFGFITIPIYTRLFTPDEYGVLGYVTTVAGLLSAVLILGGDSAYARYFFAAASDAERRVITTTWIGFLAGWSVVAVLILLPFTPAFATWSFGDDSRVALFIASFLAAPVMLVNRMCGQILRNRFQATAFTTLNLVSIGLTVALSIGAAAGLGLGLVGVVLGILAAELVMLPVRVWSAREMFGARFSPSVLGRLLAFGLPLVPTSIAYWVFLTSDRIVLAQLSTLEQVGLYSVAVGLVAVPSVAIAAVGQAWTPHAIEAYEADRDDAQRLVARVAHYVLAGFGLLCVAVTAFAAEALQLLTTREYLPATAVVGPLAIAMVAQASTSVTALGITMTKRTTYLAVVAWAAALVNLALNVALDGSYGMIGAAWATTAAYGLLTAVYLVVSQRLWHVAFRWGPLATGLGLTVAFTLVAGFIPEMPVIQSVVVKSAYCLAYAASLAVFGVVPRSDLAAAARWVRGDRAD